MPTTVPAAINPWARIARAVQHLLRVVDRRPNLVLPIWMLAYFAMLWPAAHRPLWYDELFTYHVSMSPTIERFIGSLRFVDLNPPLSYLFVRSSILLFGDSPFSARLPSMLAFLIAGLVPYWVIKRRLGGGFGLIALGAFWCTSLTAYAVEARPYALLLAFFSGAMLCWLRAAEAHRWSLSHAGLATAVAAMLMTHCFSPVLAAAIWTGEVVRSVLHRRIDRRVWTALLAPLALLPLYIPLVMNAQAMHYPRAFESSLLTFPAFYLVMMAPLLPAICLTPLLWILGRKCAVVRWSELIRPHESAFFIAALLCPTIIVGYSIWSGVPFWDRYGIGAALAVSLITAALFALVARRNANAGVTGGVLLLVLFCFMRPGTMRLLERYENSSAAYRSIRPDLPFVTASGLTFLEMDHREPRDFVRRLHYLTDRESALHYAHASIFEGFPVLVQWFPVRARVVPYRDFIKANRRFLMLATPGYPEDWLFEKLVHDGAEIRLLQNTKTGYKDRQLFEVALGR